MKWCNDSSAAEGDETAVDLVLQLYVWKVSAIVYLQNLTNPPPTSVKTLISALFRISGVTIQIFIRNFWQCE